MSTKAMNQHRANQPFTLKISRSSGAVSIVVVIPVELGLTAGTTSIGLIETIVESRIAPVASIWFKLLKSFTRLFTLKDWAFNDERMNVDASYHHQTQQTFAMTMAPIDGKFLSTFFRLSRRYFDEILCEFHSKRHRIFHQHLFIEGATIAWTPTSSRQE